MRGHSEAQEVKLGLKYPGEWKFGTTESADAVPADAVDEFFALTVQIASSADSPKSVLELFKSTFASFHGRSYSSSSSYEWAESDLSSLMHECAERSPTFIDAYWTSISKMEQTGVPAPGVEYLNSILTKYGIPYVIDPPKLLRAQGDAILLKVAEQAYNSASPRTSLERYLLVSELGHGGFGRVYHAKRTTSVGTFNFAIKILDPSPFVQNRETAKARFCREVETLQRLQHRAIVSYVDAGFDSEGRPYLVMPLIAGVTLREACDGRKVEEVVGLMLQVLEAIEYAHNNNVLHRDLKPGNILVRESDRQPIVVDFGHAYLFEEMSTTSLTTSSLVGTLGYIPSEVFANPRERSPLHDIFSCGVITYELVARRLPDPHDYHALANLDVQYASLDTVLIRALSAARLRFHSAEEFADALRNIRVQK